MLDGVGSVMQADPTFPELFHHQKSTAYTLLILFQSAALVLSNAFEMVLQRSLLNGICSAASLPSIMPQ